MTEQVNDETAEALDDKNEGLGAPEEYDGEAVASIAYDPSQFEGDADA